MKNYDLKIGNNSYKLLINLTETEKQLVGTPKIINGEKYYNVSKMAY